MKNIKGLLCLIILVVAFVSGCSNKRDIESLKKEIVRYEAKNTNDKYRLKSVLGVMRQEQVYDCADYIEYLKAGKTPPQDLQNRIDSISTQYGIF